MLSPKSIFLALTITLTATMLYGQDKPTKRAVRQGKMYYDRADYWKAGAFYKEAYSQSPDSASYAWRTGHSAFMTGDFEGALRFLRIAYNLDPAVNPELHLLLAKSLQAEGFFEEAAEVFKTELANLDAETPEHAVIRVLLDQCRNAPAMLSAPVPFKVENLGEFINSPYPEYACTFSESNDYMIFTSRRPRRLREMFGRMYHAEDINEEVYQSWRNDGAWMKTRLFEKPIPRWRHDASIALSPDGNTLFYYMDNGNMGDIYYSELQDGKWSKRASIGDKINTKEYHEPSAALSPDGTKLYWVSDKPGGLGLKDIYVSMKEADGSWGEGRNLGPEINTAQEDDAPFLSADGQKLYFASQGHNSMGGYDLFVCTMNPDGTWGKAQNLGFPINSVRDDIFLVASPDGTSFYLSSNRKGGRGDMDLYQVTPHQQVPEMTIVDAVVMEKGSNKLVDAKVRILDPVDRTKQAAKLESSGKGTFQLQVPECGQVVRIEVTVPPSSPQVASSGNVNMVSGRIEDAVTNKPLDAALELLDPKTKEVLQVARTNPATGNYFIPIESGKQYILRVQGHEYLPYYENFSVAQTGAVESHYEVIGLQRQGDLNMLVITWQFFDVDQAVIKSDYLKDLDNLAEVLKGIPGMKLRITGHTDSDGPEAHNLALSQHRAEAVAQHLIAKGVDGNRLEVHGEGEAKPIYPNTNSEQKRWNRRVELTLIPE